MERTNKVKEVTAEQLAKAFEGQIADIVSTGDEGISFEMSKARIDYDETSDELTFTTGNHNHGGVGSVRVNVEEFIDSIEHFEDYNEFCVTFSHTLSSITVSRYKSLEELQKERAEKNKK